MSPARLASCLVEQPALSSSQPNSPLHNCHERAGSLVSSPNSSRSSPWFSRQRRRALLSPPPLKVLPNTGRQYATPITPHSPADNNRHRLVFQAHPIITQRKKCQDMNVTGWVVFIEEEDDAMYRVSPQLHMRSPPYAQCTTSPPPDPVISDSDDHVIFVGPAPRLPRPTAASIDIHEVSKHDATEGGDIIICAPVNNASSYPSEQVGQSNHEQSWDISHQQLESSMSSLKPAHWLATPPRSPSGPLFLRPPRLPSGPRFPSPPRLSSGPRFPSPPASPPVVRDINPLNYSAWTRRPATPSPLSSPNLVADESGRRSASGYTSTPRPEPKPDLRRRVLSPTLQRHPKTQSEKRNDVDIKEWKVFTEDDDDNMPPSHEIYHGVPAVPDSSRLDARSTRPISPLPQGKPVRSFGIAHQISASLVSVFQDLGKYKKFLSYRNEDAQRLLNFLQWLLDRPSLHKSFRAIIFLALLRLSRKSALYPKCFTLTNIAPEEEGPIVDGHSGGIYRGNLRGRGICLKVVKMYCKSDQVQLHKALSHEALVWGQLSHPNVLPFYGICQLGSTHNMISLVSPWMQSGNVNDFLKRKPDADRRLLISDVAAGMLYLHKNKVVHGDLKGANVLVTVSMRGCLADFGLDSGGGTIRFRAPELMDLHSQRSGSDASDVYAFALVCYQIFTGNHPFPAFDNYTVMVKVGMGERPTRPEGQMYLHRGLGDLMWRLMEDCWKHVPQHRPNAYQIFRRLRRGAGKDTRPNSEWDDLSASRFRLLGGYGDLGRNGISVAEMQKLLRA